MLVHKFVDGDKPIMVLLHGVLTPWQVWLPQIDSFKKQYNIFVIALNAHTEEAASEFISVLDEAKEIIQYFENNDIVNIDVLCGLSLGGKIAYEICKSERIRVRNLIMDGAPLASCPKFAINIMIKNYKKIINKSRKRNKKIFKKFKSFLPEKYLNNYLKIADLFTESSVENIVNSVFAGGELIGIDNQCRILFIHGTKASEVLSKYSAKLVKQCYPKTKVVSFRGDSHCFKAIFEPDKWIEVVKDFLEN